MKPTIRQALVALITGTLLHVNAVYAVTDEREAILAFADKVFAAVNSQNPDDWRTLLLEQGGMISFREAASGEPGSLQMHTSSHTEFLAGMQKSEQDYREVWTAEPAVLIRGPMAVVWGPYEFTIDGEFSHCGINSIDLVKPEGEWKIANIMWTQEKDNCPKGTGD